MNCSIWGRQVLNRHLYRNMPNAPATMITIAGLRSKPAIAMSAPMPIAIFLKSMLVPIRDWTPKPMISPQVALFMPLRNRSATGIVSAYLSPLNRISMAAIGTIKLPVIVEMTPGMA